MPTKSNDAQFINEQVSRIHRAMHDGTLDKATIDDACAKLTGLTSDQSNPNPAHGVDASGHDTTVRKYSEPVPPNAGPVPGPGDTPRNHTQAQAGAQARNPR